MTANDNPIERIRARLDGGNKWHKGSVQGPDGSMCLVGMCQTFGDFRALGVVWNIVSEQYPDRTSIGVPSFNDHPDTTWADIELVLDKASLLWEERAALAGPDVTPGQAS